MRRISERLLRLFDMVAEGSVSLMVVALVALVFQSVMGRYFLNRSDIYTQELTQLLYPWIVFIGIAIAYKEKSHLSVTFLVDRFPGKVKKYIEFGQTILIGVLFACLTVVGYRLSVRTADQITPTLAIRKTWFYLSVPLGALFTLRYVLERLLHQARRLKGGA
jgi:TRAP-type C4-dicarboxylate transport system permease small subunit